MAENADDLLIERCARIADNAVLELKAIMASSAARTHQYDRQTKLQIETAIRWVTQVSVAIRDLKHGAHQKAEASPLDAVMTILKEIRPLVAGSGKSMWRDRMLQKIDAIIAGGG